MVAGALNSQNVLNLVGGTLLSLAPVLAGAGLSGTAMA